MKKLDLKFLIILAVVVFVPLAVALIGNPFGAYLCAYVSTALIMFSVFEFAYRLRSRESKRDIYFTAFGGLLTGVFMNMSTVVGPSLYIAFLFGQAITVGLVLWLAHTHPRFTAATR